MAMNILVPIDLAQKEAGAKALAFARQLDPSGEAQVVLLTVVSEIPDYVATQMTEDIMEHYGEHAANELQAFANDNGGQTATTVRAGHPSRGILDYAQSHNVDLIVIASHDPNWKDFMLGSVAAAVVRHAHCSVLVFRNRP